MYVARASGSRAFWELLAQAIADCNVSSVAVSLNSHCVLDDELPARLEQACTLAAGNADWAVLAATGKCVSGNTYSVGYPSAAPRFFACSVPIPLVERQSTRLNSSHSFPHRMPASAWKKNTLKHRS